MTVSITVLASALCFSGPGVVGDTCDDAIEIIDGVSTFDTSEHSDSGYSPDSTCDLMGIMYRDIWFSYHARNEGVVTLSTCNVQSFDTSIIVYEIEDDDCDALVYLACSGDAAGDPACQPYHSVAEFIVSEGRDYIVRVGGWNENSFGSGSLTLSNSNEDIPQYCPTDVNDDQTTDVNDVLAIIGQWGTCADCSEDVDGDGVVDVNDLLQVIGAWGPCPLQGTWRVLLNSPVAPYFHHDGIAVLGDDIWVCNISGEIWKSADGGESWMIVANQPGTAFRSISFADAMHGFAGNLGPGSWVGDTTDTNPLYTTNDGGLTWNPVPFSAIDGPIPDGICGIQAIGPSTIHGAGRYAGGAYFVSSTDGGATWVSRDLNDSYYAFVDVFFETPEQGYITGTNQQGRASLVYTDDGGETWTTKITNNSGHYWKMGFASEAFGYAVCSGGQDGDKWVQTYDGGTTWTEGTFTDGFHANGIGFINDQVGWIGGYPNHTLQTWNGGTTWEPFQIDLVYGDVINKFLKVSDTVMYAVGNRVYKYSPEPARAQDCGEGEAFDNSRCTLTATTTGESTTITYTVPEDDNVEITVFIRGGLIHGRPVYAFHRAGTYAFEFETPRDAPELYVAIVAGDYRQWTTFAGQP